MTEEAAGTYRPMRNARTDFDPMGQEWSYILDSPNANGESWRGMVPVNLRSFTWPYRLHSGRIAGTCGSARLAPDWAYYAWRNEYVLVSWMPAAERIVSCQTVLERRYAPEGEVSDWPRNPFAGEGNERWRVCEWTARITLDLLHGTRELDIKPCGRPGERPLGLFGGVQAEAEHKAGKLLAFFRAECGHWKAGDQERPVQARDLYLADAES